jgi:hypothetical protein
MKTLLAAAVAALGLVATTAGPALAFCGFYVGRADSSLFNEASQVILVRDGDRTTISMLNDYKGELKDFALVVPVPVVLKREDVGVIRKLVFDRLDVYSSPRLVRYHDETPCPRDEPMAAPPPPAPASGGGYTPRNLGVTVEQSFTVGEYDIVILSAKDSDGLETWLTTNGYRIPQGASAALKPYIVQGLKFFVAKVNLGEQAKTGAQYLRPLQFSFESPRFMLPVRLGMINGNNAPQDLIVYTLTRKGRVETTNYRTTKIPSDIDVPNFLAKPEDFKAFYKTMFERLAAADDYRTVFTEHFWDMSWCDPCAADPLDSAELREAGVFWQPPPVTEKPVRHMKWPVAGDAKVMLTRLHLRYTRASLPEDLAFQETNDRTLFQARYVMHEPWTGDIKECPAEAQAYFESVVARQRTDADRLSRLTGWKVEDILKRYTWKSPVIPGHDPANSGMRQ